MRSFSKKLAFVLAAAMVVTAFAPAAKAEAAKEMEINAKGKILYVTDGEGINDAAQVGGGKGNVAEYDFYVKNKPDNWKKDYSFEWKSSNDKIITVGKGGLTTAVAVGEADVICVVTEKATGTKTTLTNTVTVKANAAEVEIINAEDWDGETVEAGTVVDLNRKMVDAAGNETTKRGEYVTDKTMWVAEPATGVKITQSNGKFEFTEEALAQDYTLYCYTYQSDKYKAATATSDKIVVTYVAGNEIEAVAQKSATKFTLEFGAAVKALAVADVKLTRLLKVGTSTYEYPEQVKNVSLAKDGLSADVEIFGTFADKTEYVIEVTGFEAINKTMTLGKPTKMTLAAKDAQVPYVLTVDKATEIVCTFYNDDDVDVTTGTENVIFRLENRSTDGSYYLAGNKLTIKKEGVYPVVVAEYQGWIDNGKKVGTFSEKQEFTAVKSAPVVVNGVSLYTVDPAKKNSWDVVSTFRKSDTTKQLCVEIEKSDTTKYWVTNNQTFDNAAYKVTYTAMNPEIAVVAANGNLTAFKTGTAFFYVNVHAKKVNAAGYEDAVPVAIIAVTVEEDAAFSYITLDNNALTIGTADNFNTGSVKLTSYDNYNQKYNFAADKAITVECNTDGFDKTAFASAISGAGYASGTAEATITFDAQKIITVLAGKDLEPKAGDAAVVYFTVKYNNQALDVTVTVQKPSEDENGAYVGNYINIESSATYVDAVRKLTPNDWNNNTEDAKKVTFKVFELNNGVKVAPLAFGTYPEGGDAKAVSTGAYVYRLLKDGKDYASTQNGNEVTIALSTTAAVSNGGVQAKVVDYTNMGAGTYEFALFKCYGEGDSRVLVQEYSSLVSVEVTDAGSYNLVGDILDNEVEVVNTYNESDAFEILKCFTIKDRDGNDVVDRKNTATLDDDAIKTASKYFVNYNAPDNAGYVYVKDITFYEEVGTEDGVKVYVPYVVNIDTVLNNK